MYEIPARTKNNQCDRKIKRTYYTSFDPRCTELYAFLDNREPPDRKPIGERNPKV